MSRKNKKGKHTEEIDLQDETNLKQARKLRGLFKERFTEKEVWNLLEHNHWDQDRTVDFVLNGKPDDVRKVVGDSDQVIDMQEILYVREDLEIRLTATKGAKIRRQFACENCDSSWWDSVPVCKQVSTCKKCFTKYDPVPRDSEWGIARFECECGHKFTGWGQISASSPCYSCSGLCRPLSILPPRRQAMPKSANEHCCDAPDCYHKKPGLRESFKGGKSDLPKTCPHPRSRAGKKQVLYPSLPHISTGSTVDSTMSRSESVATGKTTLGKIAE